MKKKGIKLIGGTATLLVGALLLIGIGLLAADNVAEAQTISNATVTVQIGAVTIIDITPEKMNFTTAIPGDRLYQYVDPDNNITLSQIQIENLGSTNITRIWFNVTQPSSNPFGTGNVANYNPGNWLLLKHPTDAAYGYVDRIEWNSSYPIVYLEPGLPKNWKTYGKIRMGNHEYFWTINGTSPFCNTTGNTIVIGQIPHNETQTGTINLVSGNITVSPIVGISNPEWGLINGTTIEGTTYCIAVSADCSTLRIYKWNGDAPGAGSCGAYSDFATGLVPGASVVADVAMYVPYGVPQGTPSTGYLTVVAEAA